MASEADFNRSILGSDATGVALGPGEGRSLWVLGDLYTFKVAGDEGSGRIALVEVKVFPGNGVPPHKHHAEDETFYVLEGTFSFLCGDQTVEGGPGTVVHVPRSVTHAFQNTGASPARMLAVLTPSGFERFFEAIGEPVIDPSTPPAVEPATIEKMMRLAPDYHLEILPPPGAA